MNKRDYAEDCGKDVVYDPHTEEFACNHHGNFQWERSVDGYIYPCCREEYVEDQIRFDRKNRRWNLEPHESYPRI